MREFLETLRIRDPFLFVIGLIALLLAFFCVTASFFDQRMMGGYGILSSAAFHLLAAGSSAWSIAWLKDYLFDHFYKKLVSLIAGFTIFGFCTINMIEAMRGASMVNMDLRPFDQLAFLLQLITEFLFLCVVVTLTLRFFKQHKMPISQHYTWGIRMGLLIYTFVYLLQFLVHCIIFNQFYSLTNESYNRIIENWYHPVGGLRVFFIMGFFSLQLIPLASYFFISKKKEIIVFTLIYFMCMLAMFCMTLLKQPLFPF